MRVSVQYLFLFLIIITMSCKKDPSSPPEPLFELINITRSPQQVYINSSVTITANVYNPDNDTLRYLWKASGGTFDNYETNPVVWHSPDTMGVVSFTLQIFDSKDTEVKEEFQLVVGNQAPVFQTFQYSSANVIIGNTLQIKALFSDPNGQDVSTRWFSSGGTILEQSKDSIVWQAPTVPGEYKVWLEISDSLLTTVSDTLTLRAYREYGCIWVIERGSNTVKKFTDNGMLLFTLNGFNNPMSVKVNPRDKSCWVADASYNGNSGKLYRISFNGDTIRAIGNFTDPQDLDVYILEKDVWLLDSKQNALYCISPISFQITKTIQGFNHPLAVEIDQPSREVWVADTDNDRVVSISFDVPAMYNVETDSGYHRIIEIEDPVDITADQNDDAIWIAQRFHNKVTYIKDGYTPLVIADLIQPMNVQAGINSGESWISDTGQNRVLKFVSDRVAVTVEDGFLLPTKLSLNVFDGTVWILDSQNNRLVKIDNNGTILKYIMGLHEPWDISVNFGE
ncbi:MAG: hypothetical protein Kow00108_06050 [Calditrichia bacterium]